MDRDALGSWLEGPQGSGDRGRTYPGQGLGLPEHGSGSVARLGRRLGAVFLDWFLAMLISAAFAGSDPWATLGIFGVTQILLVGTAGFSVGHRAFGLQVRRLTGGLPGPGLAARRSVLLCLAIPPLVYDRDQRGLHDRAAGTVLVRR